VWQGVVLEHEAYQRTRSADHEAALFDLAFVFRRRIKQQIFLDQLEAWWNIEQALEVFLRCGFCDGKDLRVACQFPPQRQRQIVEQICVRMATNAEKQGPFAQFRREAPALMQDLILVELRAHRQVDRLILPKFSGTHFLQRAPAHLGELLDQEAPDPKPLTHEHGTGLQFVRNRSGTAGRRVDQGVHVEDRSGELAHRVLLLLAALLGGPAVAVAAIGLGCRLFVHQLLHDHHKGDDANKSPQEEESPTGVLAAKADIRPLRLLRENGDHGSSWMPHRGLTCTARMS